jgi:hypothetical protein
LLSDIELNQINVFFFQLLIPGLFSVLLTDCTLLYQKLSQKNHEFEAKKKNVFREYKEEFVIAARRMTENLHQQVKKMQFTRSWFDKILTSSVRTPRSLPIMKGCTAGTTPSSNSNFNLSSE